ncbi:Npr3p [Sporobolomyces koalae]|uniref:Npr3p n=1 Tax=Sporobolomyces koalae TaxID=500713 RepID=UPI003171E349
MSSLLAILLVAKSSLGAHLVYGYPSTPHPVPRTTKPIYHSTKRQQARYQQQQQDEADLGSSSSEDSSDGEDEDGPDREHYLGLPDDVLSSLLSPSRELCDQPFELVVDQYAFVGHPVWLGDDDAPREKPPMSPKAGGSQHEDDGTEEEDHDSGDNSDGVARRGRSRQPRYSVDLDQLVLEDELAVPEGSTSRDHTIGPPPNRTASVRPRPLLVEQLSPSPPASPVPLARSHSSASTLLPLSSIASSQHSHNSLHGSGRLISFNFLCVIDTPPDSHLSSHLEGYYKDVIVPLTANIKAVEKKDLWLGKEVAKLRRARESALEKELPHADFLDTLPARSPLAAAISHLYLTLKRNELAEVNIGGLPVQVLLRGELPIEDDADLQDRDRDEYLLHGPDGHGSRSRSPSPGDETRYAVGKPMPAPLFSRMRKRPRAKFYPWQSLLLLEEPKHLQSDLLEGSVLERFLDICRPTLSFAEYGHLLDIETDDGLLEDLVDHLVHWRKAKVIDLVSVRGSYVLNPAFDRRTLGKLSISFAGTFPTLPPLPALLSQLSHGEPFSNIIPTISLRSIYIRALVWLLRHSIVEKERTYVRVVASESIKRDSWHRWSGKTSRRKSSDAGFSLRDEATSSSTSCLSTSASAASDHSFTTGYHRAGGVSDAFHPRSRQTSVRPEVEDTRGMEIKLNGFVGSPTRGGGGPGESMLSQSASSVLSARALRMAGRRGPNSTGSGSGRIRPSTVSDHSEDQRDERDNGEPSIIVEPGRPSMYESRWLSEICKGKDPATIERFERCVRMFNGRHHLDEIRYRAQLSRKHLSIVLSSFEEHLILFTHC